MQYRPAPERVMAMATQTPTGCLVVPTAPSQRYRLVKVGRRSVLAHRVVWESVHGPIPPGCEVCHTCDNPACVRPDHLFLGTHTDNMRDASRKGHLFRAVKLTAADVGAIRQRRASGETTVSLGRAFGVNNSTISRIARGEMWRDSDVTA